MTGSRAPVVRRVARASIVAVRGVVAAVLVGPLLGVPAPARAEDAPPPAPPA